MIHQIEEGGGSSVALLQVISKVKHEEGCKQANDIFLVESGCYVAGAVPELREDTSVV